MVSLSNQSRMAAGLGFEPRLMDSESIVLPLHHPAKSETNCGTARVRLRRLVPLHHPAMNALILSLLLQRKIATERSEDSTNYRKFHQSTTSSSYWLID